MELAPGVPPPPPPPPRPSEVEALKDKWALAASDLLDLRRSTTSCIDRLRSRNGSFLPRCGVSA
jgi:hypothetical protein